MKSRTSSAISTVLFAVGLVSIRPSIGSTDQNFLKAQADAELARVTGDVDSANITYSPADNGLGPRFMNVGEYQQEYLARPREFPKRANMSKHCNICTQRTTLSLHSLIGPKHQ